MGYTHYIHFNKPKRGQTKAVETAYQKAIKQCHTIVQAYSKRHGGLSGYSAHMTLKDYAGIMFNGSRENAHEDFVLRDFYKKNDGGGFCKTARKPYDMVVVACLIVLQANLGDNVEVGSDGDSLDWAAGHSLVVSVLGGTWSIPAGVRRAKLKVV
jgi:hypothetical protein